MGRERNFVPVQVESMQNRMDSISCYARSMSGVALTIISPGELLTRTAIPADRSRAH